VKTNLVPSDGRFEDALVQLLKFLGFVFSSLVVRLGDVEVSFGISNPLYDRIVDE